MKKLRLAIIGQGRSGRGIHGAFFQKPENNFLDVAVVVELEADRRERAKEEYPGCEVMEDYRELFGRDDIDLVVNTSYSDMHYQITKDLLEHNFNVVVEKPMARNYYECSELMKCAEEHGAVLAVFHQTLLSPYYIESKAFADSGKLGDIKQVSIRYSGFARRWDWQTMQERLGGSVYNTGPHPIAVGLGFLDYSDDVRVEYSKLGLALTSGDAEDYAKIILTAPGKPVVDIEISSIDAYSDYNLKIQGTKGTYKATVGEYKAKYITDGENPERPLIRETLRDENGLPMFGKETLITHEEGGKFKGGAFDIAVEAFYRSVYDKITKGTPLVLKNENAAKVISVIETVHAQNPLPKLY